ncbi:response regulator [Chitinophaga horti]|uniref:Response regulator n=1 Tax=Chitinophaga horti TaxID=2920382 RepID=A0ABY6JB22_9BACT|nr:response regulator [Chitinophaga horti]UYQ95379.1 response regulator [Chitinophaga horti]
MKKILLIEDNAEIRENTEEILELAGYKVLTAPDGKKGMEVAIRHRPDLVVCDIMMPVLDGYGVLHMMQRNEDLKGTPFIFLSAKSERGDFRKGMDLGADDYITKPFTGTDLLNAVESRLRKAELKKEQFSPDMQGLTKLIDVAGGKNALQHLREGRNIEKYKKKQVIYSEGNRPQRLYYLQKGKVKTYKRNDDGKELVVELYNTGDFLGHIALLEGGVYKDTAEAIEEAEVAVIPLEDFENLLNNNNDVAVQFLRMLAGNVSTKEQQLLGLAYNSLRKKVAEALMNLMKKYSADNDGPFSIDISRDNLATIAGTATESLIRTLGDFREEKLIDIQEGSIVILNKQKLAGLLY